MCTQNSCLEEIGYQWPYALTGTGLCLYVFEGCTVYKGKEHAVIGQDSWPGKEYEMDLDLDKVEKLSKQEVRRKIRATKSDFEKYRKIQVTRESAGLKRMPRT